MEKLEFGYVDLHTHSTASDGSMSPAELVNHAIRSGLKGIAITDHDTIDGVAEALDEGQKNSFPVIPGVEISLDYTKELHMLGYFNNENYNKINEILIPLKKSREKRNEKTIEKLNELGFKLTMDEVRQRCKGSVIGRPHIALVMQEKGYTPTAADAFREYLGFGRVAFFKKEKLTPEQGIGHILRAGGLPVLAHPVFLQYSMQDMDKFLKELFAYGLKGIEAYYVENSKDYTKNTIKLADKHKLIITGGSDFHGTFKPKIKIGTGYGNLKIPYKILEDLRRALG